MSNSTLKTAAERAIDGLNTAIDSDSFSSIGAATKIAQDAVKALNKDTQDEFFAGLMKDANPFMAAIKACYQPIYKITGASDEDKVLEKGEAVLNLVDFNNSSSVDLAAKADWQLKLAKFTQYLNARVIKDVGSDADKAKFEKLYKISKAAQAQGMNTNMTGKDPLSNTQLTKLFQEVVDSMVFVDDGSGETLNTYKVTSKDVNYMMYLMCSSGSGRSSISTPRTQTILNLVTKAYSRILNNGAYALEFETKKVKKTDVAVVETTVETATETAVA